MDSVGTVDFDAEDDDGSVCHRLDGTMGLGQMFDRVGTDYLKSSRIKFQGSWFGRPKNQAIKKPADGIDSFM